MEFAAACQDQSMRTPIRTLGLGLPPPLQPALVSPGFSMYSNPGSFGGIHEDSSTEISPATVSLTDLELTPALNSSPEEMDFDKYLKDPDEFDDTAIVDPSTTTDEVGYTDEFIQDPIHEWTQRLLDSWDEGGSNVNSGVAGEGK